LGKGKGKTGTKGTFCLNQRPPGEKKEKGIIVGMPPSSCKQTWQRSHNTGVRGTRRRTRERISVSSSYNGGKLNVGNNIGKREELDRKGGKGRGQRWGKEKRTA